MPLRRNIERKALGFTPMVLAMSPVRSVASADTISVISPVDHFRLPPQPWAECSKSMQDRAMDVVEWEAECSTVISLWVRLVS